MENQKNKTALVTGSAGFIGYHISKKLLEERWRVVGLDCMSDYYDVSLKEQRESMLMQSAFYRSVHEKVETPNVLMDLFEDERPDVVIHLAAQAGVSSKFKIHEHNLKAILKVLSSLEAARAFSPAHMLLASTSSTYGANEDIPYRETTKADHQMSFYAATKKSTENMAHRYAHLFDLPITMFRFFTVYGPWGRPDMALFKFTRAILSGEPIDVYNNGDMSRDFTYIDDLINSMHSLIEIVPDRIKSKTSKRDSTSPVAPFRVVNIGNSCPQNLIDFIEAIEAAVGRSAVKIYKEIQDGDVPNTFADISLLKELINYAPSTGIEEGVKKFVAWYRNYYQQ